jgi:APA family basic amino acid/polyamine antiporter
MSRKIGRTSAALLVVGNMIGAGAFTISGFALESLGSPAIVLLAWAMGGVVALCGALSYGALARALPESGGEYNLLRVGFHPLAGFLAGWVSLLAGFTAPIAAAALALEAYLAAFVGASSDLPWIGTLTILLCALIHGVGVREGVRTQDGVIVAKLLGLVVFIGIGSVALLVCGGSATPDIAPSISLASGDLPAFAITLVWISFAYSGWNAAVYVAGELRAPEHNLMPALVIATLGVTVLYLAFNAVLLYSAPISALAGHAEIGALAAFALGGVRLRAFVSVLVCLALFTSISAMVMVGPRVIRRMAEDGFLPGAFAGGGETPRAAIALQTALALGALWSSPLASLLGYVGFLLGLSAAATVASVFRLRRQGLIRISVPGHPVVPAVFIAVTLASSALLALREPGQAAAGVATLLLGLPFYWRARRGRSELRPASARAEAGG